METPELTLWQRIRLETLWGGMRLFAAMPYWFKYHIVENLLFFLLYYVLRYRMKVVRTNLRNSFPEKSERELRSIRRKFYRTLAEIFVDTVDLARCSADKARRMLVIEGLEEHRERVCGRDWIAMLAHFGCWEYCSFWGLYEPSQMVVAVYHPLHDPVMEQLYLRLRNSPYATTVAMKECVRFYLRHRETGLGGKNMGLGLIADQNPPRRPNSHWFSFLNQDTIFFDGGEKLALKFRLPVYFTRMERLRRGRYRMSFEMIYDGAEEVAENEITARYVERLEAMIRERPELWMWSHRRWKHKRDEK
ncbi:MAG: lysophospholipid acyltransferase family protein [Alistipes sp.]|nr:lysophospholipid acyltransferase family protein [Alistipes senegalensis]MCM1249638.1 lysophospholipid acyltransferase family protein [Alistipes sp.]